MNKIIRHFKQVSPRQRWQMSVISLLLLVAILASVSGRVFAQDFWQNVTTWLGEKAGFTVAVEKGSQYLFTKVTPNYTAFAGEAGTNGGHRLRLERDGYGLEFSFLSAKNITIVSGGAAEDAPATPSAPPPAGDKDNSLADLSQQLLQLEQDLSSVSAQVKKVGSQVQGVSQALRSLSAKAQLVEEPSQRMVAFNEVLAGVNMVYRLNPGGVKEEIVIKEKNQQGLPYSFIFTLKHDDLTYKERDGGVWYFYNAVFEPVFRLPKGWAKDASGAFTNDVSTVIYQAQGETRVSISVPPLWLADEKRVFPITIDPTIEVIPEIRQGSLDPLAKRGVMTLERISRLAKPTTISEVLSGEQATGSAIPTASPLPTMGEISTPPTPLASPSSELEGQESTSSAEGLTPPPVPTLIPTSIPTSAIELLVTPTQDSNQEN